MKPWNFSRDRNLISILHLLKRRDPLISWDEDSRSITHERTGNAIRVMGRSNVYTYEIVFDSHPRKYLRFYRFHIRPGQIIQLLTQEK